MKRSELEALAPEELSRMAAQHGIEDATSLPREALLARLADPDTTPTKPDGVKKPGALQDQRQHDKQSQSQGEKGQSQSQSQGARQGQSQTQSQSGKPASSERPSRAPASAAEQRDQRRHPAGVPSSVTPDRPPEQDPQEMARLYLDQHEPERAAAIYRDLLRLRPDDAELTAVLAEAERAIAAEPPALAAANAEEAKADAQPTLPAEPAPSPPANQEPLGMLDLEEPPDSYGVDECEVLFKDPHLLFVYWEVTDHGLSAARRDLGEEAQSARLVMRIFSQQDRNERGPDRESRDHDLDWNHGRRYFAAPRSGARVRAAVGLVTPSGLFAPIAHSSQVRVPPAEPASVAGGEWMEVAPEHSRGQMYEPITPPARGHGPHDRMGGHGGGEPGARSGATPAGGDSTHGPYGTAGGSPSSPWRWRPGSQS